MNSETEPALRTDPALDGVLRELSNREPIFHRPEWGTARADFERMTAPDFWEIGASGRRYSRGFVLDTVEKRFAGGPYPDVWQTSDFYCRELAPDLYQLTYTLLQDGGRKTRRSTIWRRTAEGWQAVFHQGTVVEG
jgi:hypothetical protein